MKFDKRLMAGGGSLMVLALLENEDMYGYQMIEEMERRSGHVFEMKEGTLYPLLHGLEQDGCLTSYRQSVSGRERKYYHLTRKGRGRLEERRKEWDLFQQGVGQVLRGGANALA